MYRKQHNLDGNSSSAPRRRRNLHNTNYGDRNPTVSFRLPKDLKRDFERDLDALGLSKANFLRMVVRGFVNREYDVEFSQNGRPYLRVNYRR